ncbi:MAG: biotin--[acetyl-CoA-carboxylase] ligase [Kiritimatiellaeota bacterium]|nr:biotin--[acetyl-CoA-carboxylase] ligase [Kiritimatiellota bacterium]
MIEHIDIIDSTNALALRRFAEFADGTLLTADAQTAGIGRRGRSWLSPRGVNLYATYILKRPAFPVGDAMLIGGLAALDVLRQFAPDMELWLKWPNDICRGPVPGKEGTGHRNEVVARGDEQSGGAAPEIVRDFHGRIRELRGFRKIAGLLAQTHSGEASNAIDGVAVGIGVNLNMTSGQLAEIGRPAASVFSETGRKVEPAEFAEFLLERLSYHRKTAESDSDAIFAAWVAENALIGTTVEVVSENGESVAGKVAGLRRDGALILKKPDGSERAIIAGDIAPAS